VWKNNGWQFEDNTPDEIVEAVEEIVARITHSWNSDEVSQVLQKQFWHTLPTEQNYTFNFSENLRIGDRFIKNHQTLLN
jgi:hypothetical protein